MTNSHSFASLQPFNIQITVIKCVCATGFSFKINKLNHVFTLNIILNEVEERKRLEIMKQLDGMTSGQKLSVAKISI